MHRLPAILLLASLLPVSGAAPHEDTAAPPAAPASAASITPPGTRVIVVLGRNLEVRGRVEFEDGDLIVVRDLENTVESHSKTRVLQITRLVEPSPGQRGLVVLRNGQIREGIVIEDAFDYVLLEIEGIRARLEREVVSHVVLEPTFEQRYAEFKAGIGPGMHQRHLALCRWLVDQRRYDLAETELAALLAGAELPEARKLLTIVRAQRSIAETPAPSAGTEPAAATPPGERECGPVYESDLLPEQLITHEDVNLIRVYEIDFAHPPRVKIDPDLIRTLIERYGSSSLVPASQTERTALFTADPLDIVRLMFELRARELYPRIEMVTEPHALNLFRQRVHNTWLMNNCATSRCHGGVHAGSLFLHRRGYKDERARYTNLLILERLKVDPQWPLINFEEPLMSLIIQYGLPREAARKPHPAVRGWEPVFNRSSDRMLRDTVEWIESMVYPRPAYPVEYQPPVLGDPAAGEPADTQPDR